MGAKKELDEIFSRLRELEKSQIESKGDIKAVLKAVLDFAETFKNHDEKEMLKYDKYDEHLQAVNKILGELSSQVKNIASGQEDYRTSLSSLSQEMKKIEITHKQELKDLADKHEDDIEELRTSISKKLDRLFTYANRFIGGLSLLMALSGVTWGIVSYYQDEDSKKQMAMEQLKIENEDKMQKLTEKISMLQSNQKRTYDRDKLLLEMGYVKKIPNQSTP